MRYRLPVSPWIFPLALLLFFVPSIGYLQTNTSDKGIFQPERCENHGEITLSGAYSPYSVHLIKAEVAGHIIKINAREGQMLKRGVPIMEIDCSALEKQLESLKEVLDALIAERRVLLKNLELSKKKYQRYLKLKKAGHVEEQIVEDMEAQLNSAKMALIGNRRSQAETRRTISQIEDQISKSRPSFGKDLYVSQNFKELYESVLPGEKLSRLLDVSRAKIHLVLSLSCFKRLEPRLMKDGAISFSIVLPDGMEIRQEGKIERLKIDPDNSYLYSYGFDLVFPPVSGLLWGQVVSVKIRP